MELNNEYKIHIGALREDEHLFQYEINDAFLQIQNYTTDFTDVTIDVDMKLVKHHDFLELHFIFHGHVATFCDRCTSSFPLKIWEEFNVIIKQVDKIPEKTKPEADPFVLYILRDTAFLDIEGWLSDFFALCIPIVKHCTEEEFAKKTYCDEVVLAKINNM